MNPLQLGGESADAGGGKAAAHGPSHAMSDRTETREASWFAPNWLLRRAHDHDRRTYFGGRVSIATRLWSWAAAVRWPATLLFAAVLGTAYLGLIGGEVLYSAEATLAARRGGSAERRAPLSAKEAAAVRKLVASPAVIEAAARNMALEGAPVEALAKGLGKCADGYADSGEAEVRVVCRAATAEESAAGANALAAALAARRWGGAGAADTERQAERTLESATPDPQPLGGGDGIELQTQRTEVRGRITELEKRLRAARGAASGDIATELARARTLLESLDRAAEKRDELAREAGLARRALGTESVLTFSVLQRASAARRVVPWGPAAAGLALAALALVGFAGRRWRGLRTVAEVSEVFRAPVLILERGGRTNVS